MSQNTIRLIGNLTDDPKLVLFASGATVTKMRLASSKRRRVTDDNGKEVWEDVDPLFIDVECWGQLAVNCGASLKKGFPVIVDGSLVTDFWQEGEGNNAVTRSKIMLKARNVAFDMNHYQLNSARTSNSGHSLDGHDAVPVMDAEAVFERLTGQPPSFADPVDPAEPAEPVAAEAAGGDNALDGAPDGAPDGTDEARYSAEDLSAAKAPF